MEAAARQALRHGTRHEACWGGVLGTTRAQWAPACRRYWQEQVSLLRPGMLLKKQSHTQRQKQKELY